MYEVTKPALILNGTALSEVVGFRGYQGGLLRMPSSWTAASIAFMVSGTIGGTFLPLNDEAGDLVEIAASASEAYPLPAELAHAVYFQVWSQTGGVDVNQGADRLVLIDMKREVTIVYTEDAPPPPAGGDSLLLESGDHLLLENGDLLLLE